ncbi:MAG: glycosyltransferase family 4 protein [bacterium]
MNQKPKLLFLIMEDYFFYSHFIERAIAAKNGGFEVIVVAREQFHGGIIRSFGLRFIAVQEGSRGIGFLKDIRFLLRILMIYRSEHPTIVHQIGTKPVLYGSVCAYFSGVHAVVNAPVGMGYIFSSSDYTARFLRPLLRLAYRLLVNPRNSRVVFENKDDLVSFISWRAVRKKDAVLIRGAGVNINKFFFEKEPAGIPVVMLIARMLQDKGVNEFITAAHRLYDENIQARFVLVGAPDPINPTSLTENMLHALNGKKGVEWWGWVEDIVNVLRKAHIVCLPSYREGLPKSLLEAAACGLPIVTTDSVGCREVVTNGDNGFLVPVRNVEVLVDALRKLIQDSALRQRMGVRSRLKAEADFSSERVINETLAVYSCLVSEMRVKAK